MRFRVVIVMPEMERIEWRGGERTGCRGLSNCLNPSPGHIVNPPNSLPFRPRKDLERGGREVEGGDTAPRAAVRDGDGDTVALVVRLDLLVAHGVGVRVYAAIVRVGVEQQH